MHECMFHLTHGKRQPRFFLYDAESIPLKERMAARVTQGVKRRVIEPSITT